MIRAKNVSHPNPKLKRILRKQSTIYRVRPFSVWILDWALTNTLFGTLIYHQVNNWMAQCDWVNIGLFEIRHGLPDFLRGSIHIRFIFSPSGLLVFEKAEFYPSSSYFLHRKAFFVHNTTRKDTVFIRLMITLNSSCPRTSRFLWWIYFFAISLTSICYSL